MIQGQIHRLHRRARASTIAADLVDDRLGIYKRELTTAKSPSTCLRGLPLCWPKRERKKVRPAIEFWFDALRWALESPWDDLSCGGIIGLVNWVMSVMASLSSSSSQRTSSVSQIE